MYIWRLINYKLYPICKCNVNVNGSEEIGSFTESKYGSVRDYQPKAELDWTSKRKKILQVVGCVFVREYNHVATKVRFKLIIINTIV